MAKPERNRFNINDDLVLLREIVYLNPYKEKVRWNKVQENVSKCRRKMFTVRAVKEHTDHLLKLYKRRDFANLRRSGTNAQYEEKEQLLQQILGMSLGFKEYNEPSTIFELKDGHQLIIDEQPAINPPDETPVSQSDSYYVETGGQIHAETSNGYSDESVQSHEPQIRISTPRPRTHFALQFLKKSQSMKSEMRERRQALEERRQALEERRLRLEEQRLQFEMRKFEAERKERDARLEMEMEQRRCNMEILKQQQSIINYFISKNE